MYGAIIGDIVGSIYEFNNIKTKDFPFLSIGSEFTDDTVMTVAVARALLRSAEEHATFQPLLVREMQSLGRRFPDAGYGGRFGGWLYADDPAPYRSFGNGSAMRVSPCALVAVTLEEAVALGRASAEVTHDHPEGIRGAEATAAAIFLARSGKSIAEIRAYIDSRYYPLRQTLDEIRPVYRFNETCQGTVPEAITAFLESESYEDAIRNAISIGGDSDTVAAITGSIAWSYYRCRDLREGDPGTKNGLPWPASCETIVSGYGIDSLLPDDFVETLWALDRFGAERAAAFAAGAAPAPIPLA